MNSKIDPFVLSKIDIFSDLQLDDRKNIAEKISLRNFSTGQFIISNASSSRDVFFIFSGRVRACAYSSSGKQVQFEDLEAGKMFGELSAIDGGARTSDCIAVTDATAGSMSSDAFYQVLHDFRSVNDAVLLRLTSMVRRQMERVFEFSTATVSSRLRWELLRLGSTHETGGVDVFIDNPPTHADIAARISTHREAVTKELRKLEKEGILTWGRKRCVIHQVGQLARL